MKQEKDDQIKKHRRKVGKKDFLQKTTNTSYIQDLESI